MKLKRIRRNVITVLLLSTLLTTLPAASDARAQDGHENMEILITAEPELHRFRVDELCPDCGYSRVEYHAALACVRGGVFSPGELRVENYSDFWVEVTVKYGLSPWDLTMDAPPEELTDRCPEAWYAITYDYWGVTFTETGRAALPEREAGADREQAPPSKYCEHATVFIGSGGLFHPAEDVTGAQLLTAAARILSGRTEPPDGPAVAPAGDPWYGPYVRYLDSRGFDRSTLGDLDSPADGLALRQTILELCRLGAANTLPGCIPEGAFTRAALASILFRALGRTAAALPPAAAPPFPDVTAEASEYLCILELSVPHRARGNPERWI